MSSFWWGLGIFILCCFIGCVQILLIEYFEKRRSRGDELTKTEYFRREVGRLLTRKQKTQLALKLLFQSSTPTANKEGNHK